MIAEKACAFHQSKIHGMDMIMLDSTTGSTTLPTTTDAEFASLVLASTTVAMTALTGTASLELGTTTVAITTLFPNGAFSWVFLARALV
mmetsp:Transcript_93448/g.145905  ORF Transcript_93448/g.145905 Transcript_93448/m.145905 type:complete len:89 (-) Transcript_93448:197-463(-)